MKHLTVRRDVNVAYAALACMRLISCTVGHSETAANGCSLLHAYATQPELMVSSLRLFWTLGAGS